MKQVQKKIVVSNVKNSRAKVLNFGLRFLVCGFFFLPCADLGGDESFGKASYRNKTKVERLEAEAIGIITKALDDGDPRIRAKAVEVVATTVWVELMPKVQELLKDDYVPVRFAAALAVGDTRYVAAKDKVESLLQIGGDDNTKIAAAYAMVRLGSAGSLELIRQAIRSKEQTVRANAVVLLGKGGNKGDLEFLYWVLNDDDSDDKVKFQALEAIARLGDKRILRRLWAIAFSSYADDRIMAVRAMGALGTIKAKEILITKLDDDVLEVRLAAAEQLGMLNETNGEPEVIDVFTKKELTAGMDKKDIERVNRLTALAIGQIGTLSVTKYLPRLLEDRSKSVRIAAAKAVFHCIKRK